MSNVSYKRILIIISIVSFSIMFAISVVGPLLNELAIEEGIPLGSNPNTTIGIIFALGGFTLALFQVPFAALSDRYGKRIFIVSGSILVGVIIILIGYTRYVARVIGLLGYSINGIDGSTILLALLRALQGIAAAATWPILMALISATFPEDRMGVAMGVFGASFGFGMSLGPVVGPALVASLNIYAPFILAGVLSFIAGMVSFILPESKGVKSERRFKFILDHRLISLSIIAFTLLYAMGSIVVIYPRYMRTILGLSVSSVAITMAAAALTYTFLQPLTGKLADILDKRLMIIIGLPIFTAAVAYLGYVRNAVSIYILAGIFGISAAFVFPASNALLGIISPEGMEGLYSGFYNMMLSLGVTISPIIVGVLADLTNYGIAYLSIIIPSLIALIYFLTQYSKFK